MRKTSLCNKKNAFEVRVHEFIPVFFTCVFKLHACWVDAGAIEDVVQATQSLHSTVNEFLHLRRRAHVDFAYVCGCFAFRGYGAEVGEVEIAEGDGGAEGGEFEGCCAAGVVLAECSYSGSWEKRARRRDGVVPDTAACACD